MWRHHLYQPRKSLSHYKNVAMSLKSLNSNKQYVDVMTPNLRQCIEKRWKFRSNLLDTKQIGMEFLKRHLLSHPEPDARVSQCFPKVLQKKNLGKRKSPVGLRRPEAHVTNFVKRSHAHTRTRAHAHTRTRAHAHTRTRAHAHTRTRAHAHTRTRAHAHTRTRAHAHTRTRAHAHTRTRAHALTR